MMDLRTRRSWRVVALVGAVAACGPPARAIPAPSPDPVVQVADEIAAFRDGLENRRGLIGALSEAPVSMREGWAETLDALPDSAVDERRSRWLRLALSGALAQVRALEPCTPPAEDEPRGPVGPECYAGRIYLNTDLPLSPDEIHDIGIAMRLDYEARIAELSRDALGVATSLEARDLLIHDPRYRFPTKDAMREGSLRYLDLAREAMPRIVRESPDAPIELVEVPEEQAARVAAAAYYNPPRGDQAVGRFFLNTAQANARPRAVSATAAFHEGWPGHHFQFARHADLEPLHPALAGLRSTAFVEGWGLYSEQLADELDLYGETVDRIGYLLHMQDATMALQLDAGFHALGWTREEMVDSMIEVGGRPPEQAEQYALRHLNTPGQTVSYLIGYREIVRLRDDAERRLGDLYDIRDFHEALLEPGPLPLPVIRDAVERWIERTLAEPVGS